MEMEQQNVLKKLGKLALWALGIVGVLVILIFIAKAQDKSAIGSTLTTDILATDHIAGNAEATVTLLEYSDFQCPACATYAPVMDQLMKDYQDQVRFVYRSFPIYSTHPNAEISARAGEAAGEQGKFFEFATVLFGKQAEWSIIEDPRETFKEYAGTLGLNVDEFDRYMNSNESKSAVTKSYDSGVKAKVNGTPTFFLNGKMIESPNGYEAFKRVLDDALAVQ